MTSYIGFDIGGSQLRCLKLEAGVTQNPETRPMPHSPKELGENISEMIMNQLAQSGESDKVVLGIGCAGSISTTGVLETSPNLPFLLGVDLLDLVTTTLTEIKLKKPILIQNDVTAAAFGEFSFGELEENFRSDFIYLALGTGIGAGRILNGELMYGANNFWGEVGHIQVTQKEMELCGCQRMGCWEQMASGTALGKLAELAIQNKSAPELKKLFVNTKPTGEAIGKLLEEKSHTSQTQATREECLILINELADWIALGIKDLINVCDPGCIVLGGGMIKLGENLLSALELKMKTTPGPKCNLFLASNIEWGGAMGAAELARLQ